MDDSVHRTIQLCESASRIFRSDPALLDHLRQVVSEGRELTYRELHIAEEYLEKKKNEHSCKQLYLDLANQYPEFARRSP